MPHLPKREKALPWKPERKAQSGRRYSDKRYKTTRWQRLRRMMLAQSPLCAHCGTKAANVLDHIVPVRFDPLGFWDTTNLQGLCTSCHNRKSATTDKQKQPPRQREG